MHSSAGNIVKGVALGMAVGAAAYVMSSKSMKRSRKAIKKNAAKAVRTAQGLLSDISHMI